MTECTKRLLDRRGFIRTAGGAAVGSGLLGLVDVRKAAAAPVRYPLRIPPVVTPSGLTLTAAPTVEDLGGGSTTNAWTYKSEFPGPTLLASKGDTASFTLRNGLAEQTITHLHGMLVDDVNDGHPRLAVPPGGTFPYSFPVLNRAGLSWYHAHPHTLTGKQVYLGLAGAFIVRDAEEAALGLPSGAYEVPLIVRDATRDGNGNLVYAPRMGGFLGNIPLVNGTRSPYLSVDRALYRFRLLNGANSRIFGLALGNGAPFILIGNDGGLLEAAVGVTRMELAPGERLDALVDFRGYAPGSRIMLRDLRAGWGLLELRVTSRSAGGSIPGDLSEVPALSAPQATRVFSFDGMSRINGLQYDMDRIDFQVPFAQTELWRFTSSGMMSAPHPVHVHGASFQVVSRTGGRGGVFPWERGWKDTVLLENGETVDVLIRFDAYRGLYLLHCHKLEHEDMGMMSNFEVI